MTVDTIRDEQRSSAAVQLLQALAKMTPDARECFMQDLMEALIEHDHSGDEERLNRVYKGLYISSGLHSQPDFQQALQDAEDHDWSETTDALEFLAKRHGNRASP